MPTKEEIEDLLDRLREAKPELEQLPEEVEDDENLVYRFYHHSFKVYALRARTERIRVALQEVQPDRQLDEWFLQILDEGTGHTWELEHNDRWLEVTRPIVEAFWHARYFLLQAVRYADVYESAPMPPLPSSRTFS
ncbi:hypothetical protein ACFL51_01855 [Myxococcota bacterium]